MSVLYEDQFIVCDEDAITIKNYFFPMGSKRVVYEDIKSVTEESLTLLGGKFRLWGMGFIPRWYHLDLQRPTKSSEIVLDIGEPIKLALTPEQHDLVMAVLKEKTRG